MARRQAYIAAVDEPTWVYHAYCSHGGLLYIGVARDVSVRIRQHRQEKKWWRREVDFVLAEMYPTRRQALAVEASAIHNLRPQHNIAGMAAPACLPHEERPHQPVEGAVMLLNAKGACA